MIDQTQAIRELEERQVAEFATAMGLYSKLFLIPKPFALTA